ncbi:helix-turn-helix domain-containing protein [Alicyclobacillus dauci]|uniref:Helix-turn-helix transcriptional regulator n=1 Tax=Alicyclobacillus dauci TaxID=1475485 RepID=A0ABY6YZQ4_9BACL|nr:helix-turn-helix domain-containing protein [Alicyclobacillus dauci]WAH35195.1 helix-turn-helix transcriptional regulator [Alicyclobacillus dauci]
MIKWKLREVMASKGVWTGQELLDRLEQRAGIIISHTAVMQLIKQEPKAIRFQTLEAICVALDCTPMDLIEYHPSATKSKGIQAVGEGPIRPYARSKKDTNKVDSLFPDEDF